MMNLAREYLGVVEFGTLRKNGAEIPRATKPWRNDSEPASGSGLGNIHTFDNAAGMGAYTIGDTSDSPANRIKWHKIQDGDKTLLIADRALMSHVTWQELHDAGFVFGKEINIDGMAVKCRLLTGGEEKREGGTGSSYEGGKLPNEWDNYIVNEYGIAGAPTPVATDLDTTLNLTDRDSEHNAAWNWFGMRSWCQDTYIHNTSHRASRGFASARYYFYNTATRRLAICGWRPVLEILNSAPEISIEDRDLGEKNTPFSIEYTVLDPDGDAVDLVEKINGVTLRELANVTQGEVLSLDVVGETFQGLTLDEQHTIEIIATDENGAETKRTITFTKTASPIAITGEDTDHGDIWKPFSIKYQVSDFHGGDVTVREKINGVTVKTIEMAPQNQDITFNLTSELLNEIEVGDNATITFEATNADGAIVTREHTFKRIHDRLRFSLRNPIDTSALAKRIIVNLVGSIPSGTTTKVLATNNAFDEEPVWEDITESINNKRSHVFSNTTSEDESEFGINVEIEILKNDQAEKIFIDGFGISFE